MLLKHGAVINTAGNDNATPLHDAVENYRLDCVRLLISWGASKTMRDLHGRNPVDLAVTEAMKDALNGPVISHSFNQKLEVATERPVVILTTSLSQKDRLEVASSVEKLGWKFTTKFSSDVTHLITMINADGSCPRTVKYLQAVLTGKWIVNIDWITTCLDFNKRIAENSFEVPGSTLSPKSLGPSKGRKNSNEQLPGLFSGCNFFFSGEFHSPAPPRDELISLVRLGSANILYREPKPNVIDDLSLTVPFHAEPDSLLSRCGVYIVCDARSDSDSKISEEITIVSSGLCRVTSSWILASISEFRLRLPNRAPRAAKRN